MIGAHEDVELDRLVEVAQLLGRDVVEGGVPGSGDHDHVAQLDLAALHPFAHWITPTVESRRFDARFFVARAPEGQEGAHDMAETMASFWATPAELLARFARDEVQLAPPTHRNLTLLASAATVDQALADAAQACLDPICPELVPQGDTMALTLPGDPQHSVKEARVPGPSRYVLRGERWRAEDAP